MEKDDEVKGVGNSYDFGARIYDPRIGRWLACDPLFSKYPSWSPYHFSADNPIVFNDPDGEKWSIKIFKKNRKKPLIEITLTVKVIVMTDKPVDMEYVIKSIEKRGSSTVDREIKYGDDTYDVKFNVKIQEVSSLDKVEKDDHLLVIADFKENSVDLGEDEYGIDKESEPDGAMSKVGGLTAYVDPNTFEGAKNRQIDYGARVAFHEFILHSGLALKDNKTYKGLLRSGSYSFYMTDKNIKDFILNLAEKTRFRPINLGPNVITPIDEVNKEGLKLTPYRGLAEPYLDSDKLDEKSKEKEKTSDFKWTSKSKD